MQALPAVLVTECEYLSREGLGGLGGMRRSSASSWISASSTGSSPAPNRRSQESTTIATGSDTPAGKYIRDAAFAYRLIDGRIAERWAIRDDLAMLLQLGALRPPGQPA
jgi:hypothetical protein